MYNTTSGNPSIIDGSFCENPEVVVCCSGGGGCCCVIISSRIPNTDASSTRSALASHMASQPYG